MKGVVITNESRTENDFVAVVVGRYGVTGNAIDIFAASAYRVFDSGAVEEDQGFPGNMSSTYAMSGDALEWLIEGDDNPEILVRTGRTLTIPDGVLERVVPTVARLRSWGEMKASSRM